MTAPDEHLDGPVLDDLGRPANAAAPRAEADDGRAAARRTNWPEIAAFGAMTCAIVTCVLASTRQPDHYLPRDLTVVGLVFAYVAMVVSCGIVVTQLRQERGEKVRPAIWLSTVAAVVAMLGLAFLL